MATFKCNQQNSQTICKEKEQGKIIRSKQYICQSELSKATVIWQKVNSKNCIHTQNEYGQAVIVFWLQERKTRYGVWD